MILGTKYNKIKFTIMKRFLLSVVLATSLVFTSCQFDDSDIWDTLNEYGESICDHEQRISALEELCKHMNTNIEALQTIVVALEKRDYVTNVSEVRSNGEVIGYTISFAYSDTITIYHGQDGKDGQNGANGNDGYTPQIGVMKDTDGTYYWTLDGEWLLDGKGNKIQANGVNGTDGTNGSNGTNGTNGVTPQLKIENDYWYVSYDNGATWDKLGKATGNDGLNGENGEDGDSIFKSVTQDDEYVYFNLSDGTMITLLKHDKENIQFEDLQVKAICCKNWDTNNDGELSYAEAAAVTDIGTVFKENTNIIAFTEFKYFAGIAEIPDNAFNGCSALWKIVLPENVQTIGGSAFYGCKGISSIVLPSGVITIKNSSFSNCTSLRAVYCKSIITPTGSSGMFNSNASERKMYVPVSSVYAYKTALYWKNYADYIVGYDFEKMEEVFEIPANNEIWYISDDDKIIKPNNTEAFGAKIVSYMYENGKNIIKFDGDVVQIGDSAFKGCTALSSIVIPNSITLIGSSAFSDCTSLSSITIGDRVTSIESSAFKGCTALSSIVIPNSITLIGSSAFSDCTSLSSITIGDRVTSIESSAFSNCTKLLTITIPDSVTKLGESLVFYNCTSLASVTISSNITLIPGSTFSECKRLKSIYCKALTSPYIYYYSYYTTGSGTVSGGSFPFNSGMKIYVPRNTYDTYVQYSSSLNGEMAQENWSAYKSYIEPYDF